MRSFTPSLVVAAALASCAQPAEPPTDQDCGLPSERVVEHAIILATLRHFHPSGDDLVVISTTRDDLTEGGSRDIIREFEFSDLDPSEAALDAMMAKSDAPIVLDPELLAIPGVNVILLPPEDVPTTQVTEAQAWVDFRAEYGVHGAVSVSRPGYSCDDAVIARVRECGDFCSQASWYVLERQEDNSWVVVGELGAWIS